MAPSRTSRPGVVTASSALLAGAAALIAIGMLMETYEYFVSVTVAEDAIAAGTVESGSFEGVVTLFVLIELAVVAGLVATLVLLAVLNARGSARARTRTWFFGVATVCCPSASLNARLQDGASGVSSVVQQGVEAKLPSWYIPLHVGLELLALGCLLVGLLLLTTLASRQFFRTGREHEPAETPATRPSS